MPAPRYKRPVTAEQKERRERAHTEKLAALHARLAEQIAALRSGADWRRWLDVADEPVPGEHLSAEKALW